MLLARLDPYAEECEYEDFVYDVNHHFAKHIGKKVSVKGRNLGWRNLSGAFSFTLVNTDDIWRKTTPNCDFSLQIRDTDKDNEYEAVCYHHDSPTGEYYTLTITD